MIDSENNILDSNKLYYYNIIQNQHASVPTYQSYAYISQPSISNTITPVSTVSSLNPVSPVGSVTVNQVGQGTEMATETVAKSDNARVKRAKQRIRQQIYVGKIVSEFEPNFGSKNRVHNKFGSKPILSLIRISVLNELGPKINKDPNQPRV